MDGQMCGVPLVATVGPMCHLHIPLEFGIAPASSFKPNAQNDVCMCVLHMFKSELLIVVSVCVLTFLLSVANQRMSIATM